MHEVRLSPTIIPKHSYLLTAVLSDCLQKLIVPVMERVSSKVNLTLSYIGTPTDPDDGVECKHGPGECLGNILELCAAHLYPDPKLHLGFTMCLSAQYSKIPERELVQNCALEHGLSFEDINECASSDDGLGIGMLRDSVRRSADVGVRISCTVRLEGNVRCVRDGGVWKNCEEGHSVESLVEDIEELWKTENEKIA
jgi:Gamma interferon inducible lysosomal thiol reductase (GILT)